MRFRLLAGLLLLGPGMAHRAGDPAGPTWRQSLDQGRDRLADALGGLQLSAFGDLLADTADDGHRWVASDAFEVDLAGELTDTLEVAAGRWKA